MLLLGRVELVIRFQMMLWDVAVAGQRPAAALVIVDSAGAQ